MTKVLLVLLLIFGGATEDVSPFSRGVVTDECNTVGDNCATPPSELPGRL